MPDQPIRSDVEKAAFRALKAQEILESARANSDFSEELDVPKEPPKKPIRWEVSEPRRVSLPNGNTEYYWRGRVIDNAHDHALLTRLGVPMVAVG